MRVIVVGGGIGGLSAAIALRHRGHDTVVLERALRLEAVGAGITLFANAMNALVRLGVADRVRAAGSPARHSHVLDSCGRTLTTLPANILQGAVAVHRADLQEALAASAGEIRLGTAVSAVDQSDDGVFVRASDGSEQRGDLLVGADGLHSLVRASVTDATPRYAGYTTWRGISPATVQLGRLLLSVR
jgi:2-polyprenyl-6-methoxyphenol hydroxylase-like FAD-dependent oxidoreductase